MSFPPSYNPESAEDILRYAQWLIGKSFWDILKEDYKEKATESHVEGYAIRDEESALLNEPTAKYGDVNRRGGLGNLVEEHFFHYKANSNQEPDFPHAGLELKVTPYEERIGRGKQAGTKYFVAGERLVLTMINFNERPIEMDLFKSHLWRKCNKILLVYYMRNRGVTDNLKYRISYVGIFTPNQNDKVIISQDYFSIMQKIAAGKAHEISEGDTMYLGACTKGRTAASSIVIQIENKIPAQKRAFCFKSSYMTTVLNDYFINAPEEYDSVITDSKRLEKLGFDGYVQEQVNQYVGKSDKTLCSILGLEYNGNKAQWSNIAFAILGVKSNQAEEFKKANIVVKATRIEEDGSIRENTSFPPFKFKELALESWVELDIEDDETNPFESRKSTVKPSNLQSYFASTKFLFVIFKKEHGDYILKGCQLWNMPFHDLNIIVRSGWERIRDVVREGVILTKKEVKNGSRKGKYIISNNFPGKQDNPIIHIRPHSQRAYYNFDGYVDGNPAHGNELPDGRWMTTQCFWLNNTYVKSILRDDLK